MSKSEHNWTEHGRQVIDIEMEGLTCVRDGLDANFAQAVTMLGKCRGRIVVTGIGKSGLVGRKIAATLSSTGSPAFFLHPVEGAHGDLGMIRPDDLILALSNSGETQELNCLLPSLASLGADLVAMTSNPDSTLGRMAKVTIKVAVPKEACPMNLAPTASTTAMLAVGDALAVCLIHYHSFGKKDFLRYHPGGSLGERLKTNIAQLMRTEHLPVVNEGATLRQTIERLHDGSMGATAITDQRGKLAGIFTDGDLRRLLYRFQPDLERPISEYMTKNPGVARQDQSVAQLLDLMEARAITVLPVVDDQDQLIGMIHMHDLLGKGHIKFS